MQRKIVKTADGSTTIQITEWNEQYHSMHGAVQEAQHVFLKTGLDHFISKSALEQINILEIGFGTGLNAFLTCIAADEKGVVINYEGVEAFPVSAEEIEQLNYIDLTGENKYEKAFAKMHAVAWGGLEEITPNFNLKKRQQTFETITDKDQYHLIYFDAFGARVQPELWEENIFKIMFTALKEGGVLVTYAAKGSVRRAMQSVGFFVERLPGPPGKREMLRATKPDLSK